MSEPIWCHIQFRTPAGWDEWATRLLPQYFENDWGPDEDGVITWEIQGEGNYGLNDSDLEDILAVLYEFHVPYVASSDPKYEMDGERNVFDGVKIWTGECAGYGAAVLDVNVYHHIMNGCSEYASVEHYFAVQNCDISNLSIDHLQAFPPPDPDEALSYDECEDAGLDGTLRDM